MEFHADLIHGTICNPIYNEGTILELQITIEYCRPQITHETISQPCDRQRQIIEVRGRSLCETQRFRASAIPYFTLWERSYSYKSNMISNCPSLPWAGWVYTSFLLFSSTLLSYSRCLGPVLFDSHLPPTCLPHSGRPGAHELKRVSHTYLPLWGCLYTCLRFLSHTCFRCLFSIFVSHSGFFVSHTQYN